MTPEEVVLESEKLAQEAAEQRLELAWAVLNGDVDEDSELVDELAGPFCGCPTCEVREILDAAYPHLRAGWEAQQAVEGGRPDWVKSTES